MESASVFFREFGPDMLSMTREHVVLTLISMLIAIAIALPLGILLTRCRNKWLVSSILGTAGVIQTIPSLALVALIMIAFIFLRFIVPVPAIGMPPAVVSLVLYALLPILRNTYTGIRQVDSSIVEVATGMGMRPLQVLLSVELPLALPVIMAGIRISTVWTIGVATLCSLIGAGGLGDLIVQGLQNVSLRHLFAGMVPAALLAIIFDTLLGRLEIWLTPQGFEKGVG